MAQMALIGRTRALRRIGHATAIKMTSLPKKANIGHSFKQKIKYKSWTIEE